MLNFVPEQELTTRREKLLHLLPENSILILNSASQAFRNHDTEYPFRQNSSFWYLTGFDEADACAVFIKQNSEKLDFTLFIKSQDNDKSKWTGSTADFKYAKQLSGCDHVKDAKELKDFLEKHLKSTANVFFTIVETNSVYNPLISQTLKETKHKFKNQDSQYILGKLRIEKSGWELDQLRQSARINTLAFSKVREIFVDRSKQMFTNSQPFFSDIAKPKLYEYQIEAELLNIYKQNGLDWSYPPIVASGKNATILHYNKNNSEILDSDMILIDSGCEYNYYASDITRTINTSESISFAQQEIYALVLNTHNTILAKLNSVLGSQKQKIPLGNGDGVVEIRNNQDITLKEIHDLSVNLLVQGLLDLNILSGSLEEVIETKSYTKYYMHSIGHWLGLDVHDNSLYKDNKNQPIKLTQGHVFTIEPGLYFPENDESIPPELRGLGVRIEDDIAITETGIEILSEGVDK
jgi:Xaa-Pro aminopeptidase